VLSEWNYETYRSLKASGKLGVVIEGVPSDASFEQADESVQKMYKKYQYKLDRQAWSGVWESKLDTDAKEIIRTCITALQRSRWGLSYDYRFKDPLHVTLFLYWNWPDDTHLVVDTTKLTNATVPGSSDPYKLLPFTHERGGINKPRMKKGSQEIELLRKSPNDEIVIVLDTEPNLQIAPIIIPKLEDYECKDVPREANASKNIQFTQFPNDTISDHAGPYIAPFYRSFTVNHTIDEIAEAKGKDAVFDTITCNRVGSGLDQTGFYDFQGSIGTMSALGQGQGTKTATCAGAWRDPGANGHLIQIVVTWRYTDQVCTPKVW
jgi:hypothetical protein